jgi:Transposase DDE domain
LWHGSAAVAGEGTIGAGWNRVYNRELSAVPFNHHAEHRHHIPRPRCRVTNRPEDDAALRRRGSLTVWFTDEAIAVWRATANHARRAAALFDPGDHHGADDARGLRSGIAADRRLIGSLVDLLGLALAVPDHSTLSRRSKTLDVPPVRCICWWTALA